MEEYKRIYNEKKWEEFPTNNVCNIAIENGWPNLLEWAYYNGYSTDRGWSNNNEYKFDDELREKLCRIIAVNHDFSALEWMYENGLSADYVLYYTAAVFDDLDVFVWAYYNKCEFSDDFCEYLSDYKCDNILKWFKYEG